MRTETEHRGLTCSIYRFTLAAFFLIITAYPSYAREADEDPRLLTGKRNLEAERLEAAFENFVDILIDRPDCTEAIVFLLKITADDADARLLWRHEWYAASINVKGSANPSCKVKALLAPDYTFPAEIEAARAKAVKELNEFAEKV